VPSVAGYLQSCESHGRRGASWISARRGFPDGIDQPGRRVCALTTHVHVNTDSAADVSSSSLLRQQGCGEGRGSFWRASNDVDALVSGNRYPDSGESGSYIGSYPFSCRARHCVVSKNCVREASACVERIRFIISGRRKGTKDRLRATRYVDFSPLRKARSIVERDIPIRPEFWRRDLFTWIGINVERLRKFLSEKFLYTEKNV